MDKNAIKKYAVWARRELITRVSQRAGLYEITAEGFGDPKAESVRGRVLSETEKGQRAELVRQIQKKGFEQVMEEVAYTWFNRFAALRFMEVNGSLPSRVRVFTDAENNFKPQILTEAIDLELDGLDREKVYQLKNDNDDEALFKYLIITQCNALNSILPVMFQRINDYTELLFPENLLREGSVIEQMVTMIPEEDWTDQVQIIGWLYQYYNTEPKDKVFANLKKNIKITKENIPAATQLFTPDWIVRYMVENSLGRLWIEKVLRVESGEWSEGEEDRIAREKQKADSFGWKYYLPEAPQEPEVRAQLNAQLSKLQTVESPEDIRVIDPCMGSGHILCVLFDTLMQIYEDYGYSARNAVTSILEHNLWGLDIDQRAAQLAYFSVMMKAVQYDSRLLRRRGKPVPQPHVYWPGEYAEGQEFGSLLVVKELEAEPELDGWGLEQGSFQAAHDRWAFRRALAQKYHVVVTNPPYMGSRNGMNNHLCDYVNSAYPDSKADLYSVFIEKCGQMVIRSGYYSMITQHGWMFLTSFAKLRSIVLHGNIINLLHLGPRAFDEISGEVVQSASFVLQRADNNAYNGTYCRLIDGNSEKEKEQDFFACKQRFTVPKSAFRMLKENQIAYWLSDNMFNAFENKSLGDYAKPRQGMATSDNNRFLRLWHEVEWDKSFFDAKNEDEAEKSGAKWFPYNKGGGFRKWYGNNDYLINWENNGAEVKALAVELYRCVTRTIKNIQFYFQPGVTWSTLSSGSFNARYCKHGFLFDTKGSTCFFDHEENIPYFTAFLNSNVANELLKVLAPTLDYNAGSIAKLPVILSTDSEETINSLFWICVDLARDDWDSSESSWDFKEHPLVRHCSTVEAAFHEWTMECNERFNQLKSNEEELNRIFIDLYGLQNELTPEVEDKDVTVRRADLQREIRSLISYAVGCMFGRYSPYFPGLQYAGGDWKTTNYQLQTTNYPPDPDNIIPICDDEYFTDDIVGRFVEFLRVVYGERTLEANLKYVADVLGGKGTPKQVIRNYFLNDFYKDHCKIYQKRPIYWLFDSGKKNAFKCLIYLHRYQPDTIARIRTDYVHEQQSRYRTAIADLERRSGEGSASDRVKVKKALERVTAQAEELRLYEEKIHHLADQMIAIDLDDGVKKNYEIFKDVLAKIR